MPAVGNVLVVGGGAAGAAAAILLAEGGVAVDLIDIKPDIGALGSGITLQGNALRVLRQLGVWDEISERGTPSTRSACARPTRTARSSCSSTTSGPAVTTCPPRSACTGPTSPRS
ncbi:FAD-dependent monooxygenase [Paractinoplanes durhamensis]|uniref:FAD-dependent monooxygenase n=1 Tax=Paractinoplanes durhamensis TaxID=113563 RepID=UPI003638F1E6